MKGIIMQIQNNKMILMKEDSTFIKVNKTAGAEIGREVSISENDVSLFNNVRKFVAVAAMFALVFLGGIQVYAYYTPYGYLNIDINPSVEITFNKFERIINVKGLNTDGENVIKNTKDIKNLKIEEGAIKILEASNNDYIKSDVENEIMLSTYSPDSSINDKIKSNINNSVQLFLNSGSKKAQLINQDVTQEEKNQAAKLNVSVGKFILYNKAKQLEIGTSLEDIKQMPVREIIKLINDKKKKNDDDKLKKENDEKNRKKENDEKKIEGTTQTEKTNQNKIEDKTNKETEKPKIKNPDKKDVKINKESDSNATTSNEVKDDTINKENSKENLKNNKVKDRIKQIQDRIKQIREM